MSKKAVIVQPGKLGDSLITAPIAKHYADLGYEIYWPILDNFTSIIERFDYVKPISFNVRLDDVNYYSNKRTSFWTQKTTCGTRSAEFFNNFYKTFDEKEYKFIDPCFAFPGQQQGPEKIQKIKDWVASERSWIALKYDLADSPLKKRWALEYNRSIDKEEKLFEFIKSYAQKKYGSEEYSIVHRYNSNILPPYEVKNPINFSFIKGYEIVDWLKALENATEIVCVDSCLCHFVEVAPSLWDTKKVYLGTEEPHYTPFMNNILFNNWINLSNSDVSYGASSPADL
tara:strand:+ start:3278 stop:4132 length:855 start_codon:yes stop_codon:yes gene_type:complete